MTRFRAIQTPSRGRALGAAARLAALLALVVSAACATEAPQRAASTHASTVPDSLLTEGLSGFLTDRPEAAELLETRDSLRQWMADEMSGATTGLTCLWDPSEPSSGRKAEHDYIAVPGSVVFRVSRRQSPWDQIAGMVFELFNAQGHEVFDAIHERALAGQLDRDTFIRQVLEQEFIALRANQAFLHHHLANESDRVRRNSMISKLLDIPPTLDEHLRNMGNKRGKFLEFYEQLYEQEYGSNKNPR